MDIKSILISALLVVSSTAFADFKGTEKWFALNNEGMRIFAKDSRGFNEAYVLSKKYGNSRAQMFFLVYKYISYTDPAEEIYVTVNGHTSLWGTKVVKSNDPKSLLEKQIEKELGFEMDRPRYELTLIPIGASEHKRIINLFMGNRPVKIELLNKEFSIPTKGFNSAYKLLKK